MINRKTMLDIDLVKNGEIPLTRKEPSMLLDLRNRVVSDVAALTKGNMLLLNLFEDKSRISNFLNLLRL